jgi:hypothetical protein
MRCMQCFYVQVCVALIKVSHFRAVANTLGPFRPFTEKSDTMDAELLIVTAIVSITIMFSILACVTNTSDSVPANW